MTEYVMVKQVLLGFTFIIGGVLAAIVMYGAILGLVWFGCVAVAFIGWMWYDYVKPFIVNCWRYIWKVS